MVSPVTDRRLGLVGNTAYKSPATVVATTPLTLSGEQTVDGVAVHATNAAGRPDRVLATAQTDATQNGLWDVSTAAWTRSVDANGNYDLSAGTQILVVGGSHSASIWVLTTPDPITIGTTALAFSVSVSAASLATLAGATGSSLVGFLQAGSGAVLRTIQDRLRDTVNVKDFGAIGTAVPGNVTADTAAFAAALATGKSVYVPAGTYYSSSTISIGAGQRLYGAGESQTFITYTGTGVGIYMGSPSVTLQYDCACSDLKLLCTNRASTVFGVMLENCVHFVVENLTIVGSGNPNSVTPADWVLYGAGLYLVNNSIIGRVSHVSCRIWNFGYYLKTLAASQSDWTAAIVFDGQGELANNMYGIVVGDATIAFYSGVGCSFRDLTIQGSYSAGMVINSGDNTVVDSCYFEGNASHDVIVGTISGAPAPIGVKLIECIMETESIGTTNYGTFPYLDKVSVLQGSFTTIRNCNLSISTSIPLITIAAAASQTAVTGNRLNSIIATTSRISDSSADAITADNFPENPRAKSASLTRTLNASSGTVAYTGVGFRPTSVEFFGSVDSATERTFGVANVGLGIEQRCMSVDSSGVNLSSTDCIRLIKASAGNECKATLASFDSDGFSLVWVKVGAPPANNLIVNYIARR